MNFRIATAASSAIILVFGMAGALLAQQTVGASAPAPAPAGSPSLDRQASAIVREIMAEYRIVGATLAIAKDGKMLMARGFGLANADRSQPVVRDTLFCTASVSKPITAVAILKLVDDGKLKLDAKLVDVLPDLKPLGSAKIVDPRFRAITVHELLYHAGGFSRDGPKPATALARKAGYRGDMSAAIIYRLALARPLEFAPGTDARYSNFGFIVLRLVVEHASGQPFEQFVRAQVLAPMGITDMQIELTRPQYAPNEARRYAPGGRMQLTGGHDNETGPEGGNWLASSTDLVQFLMALDGTSGHKFLSDKMTELMLAEPPSLPPRKNGTHFGLGWDTVRQTPAGVEFSKNGGKPGVMAWLEHRANDVDWALLFNTGFDKEDEEPNPISQARKRIGELLDQLQ